MYTVKHAARKGHIAAEELFDAPFDLRPRCATLLDDVHRRIAAFRRGQNFRKARAFRGNEQNAVRVFAQRSNRAAQIFANSEHLAR